LNILIFAMAFNPQPAFRQIIFRYLGKILFQIYVQIEASPVRLEGAEKHLRNVIQLSNQGGRPPEASDYEWLGDILMERARLSEDPAQAENFRREAIGHFQQALRINPVSEKAQRRLQKLRQRFPGFFETGGNSET